MTHVQDVSDSVHLACDGCGCRPRKPAINLCLRVYCHACAAEVGMDTGEYGEAYTYNEWLSMAARRQAAIGDDGV
jgi:hypothetical protein